MSNSISPDALLLAPPCRSETSFKASRTWKLTLPIVGSLVAAAAAGPGPARADDFPNRPIRVRVDFSPAGINVH